MGVKYKPASGKLDWKSRGSCGKIRGPMRPLKFARPYGRAMLIVMSLVPASAEAGNSCEDQSFAVTLTPSTDGMVFGAPMAAPMIIGNGTGFSGAALIVRLFGPSR